MPFFGHKSRREREWEEVRASAQDDLVALGDDIRSLDVDIQMPEASPPRPDSATTRRLQAYQRASEIFDRAKRPEDLAPVSETLEEGRYAMAYTKALLEGKPPPERRPPCFFDPRHGPSTEDVEWAPPGGSSRPVPACAADALRIKEGFQPHGRQVTVDGRPTDYWNAPRHYGPWAGGYFNGFGGGGLLSTLAGGLRARRRPRAGRRRSSVTCSAATGTEATEATEGMAATVEMEAVGRRRRRLG